MSATIQLLADRSLSIASAVTIVLAVAAIAVVVCSSPLHRERMAGLGIVSSAVVFVLMLVPLPGPVGRLVPSLAYEQDGHGVTRPEEKTLPVESPAIPPVQVSPPVAPLEPIVAFTAISLPLIKDPLSMAGSRLGLGRQAAAEADGCA